MEKKRLLPRASLTSPQLGLSGAGLLALWQHMFGAKNTIDLHFFYMNFTKQKCSFVQKWSQKWALQLITSEIYRLMKSHNSTCNLFLYIFFFFLRKSGSICSAPALSLFDECAFKAVQLKSGLKEEKQQWDLWDTANAISHGNSSSVWEKQARHNVAVEWRRHEGVPAWLKRDCDTSKWKLNMIWNLCRIVSISRNPEANSSRD